jgi:hypothetical protein
MRQTFAASALLILATVAAAQERPRYSAQETLRRAQVGTFSPRLAPPVRVQVTPRPGAGQFDRLECREEPNGTPQPAMICTPRKTEEVK